MIFRIIGILLIIQFYTSAYASSVEGSSGVDRAYDANYKNFLAGFHEGPNFFLYCLRKDAEDEMRRHLYDEPLSPSFLPDLDVEMEDEQPPKQLHSHELNESDCDDHDRTSESTSRPLMASSASTVSAAVSCASTPCSSNSFKARGAKAVSARTKQANVRELYEKRSLAASCMNCKKSVPPNKLFYCTRKVDKSAQYNVQKQKPNEAPKRDCRKKFCHACLERKFPKHFVLAKESASDWVCPRCVPADELESMGEE